MTIKANERAFELSSEDLANLAKYGRTIQVAKGDEIFSVGDEPDTLWLVKEGRIHLTKTSSAGAESLVAFYGAGQSFCVAATIVGKPFPCSAHAATDSVLLAVPASAFKRLFDQLPAFAKRLLTEMAPQFCDAHCDCALNVESVETRLATTMLRLDRQFDGGSIPFTRQELAQMVNTTVESCIRTLSSWSKKGWIEGGRGEVLVKDRDALEEMAQVK
jgi:CRP/FNR family transcriptional regulator